MAGQATARRRSSVLAAASALASLAGGGGGAPSSSSTGEATTINTQMTEAALLHPTSKAMDLQQERWLTTIASDAAAEDVPCTFPQKLMAVLDNDQMSDIVTWLPHGKGFIILQKKRFASEVMPLYFKHSKFTSFTRKLNRWGFTRVTRGPESGAYYHKYFQRGDHHMCLQMHCQSKPNTNNSPRPSPPPLAESPAVEEAASAPTTPVKSPGSNVTTKMSSLRVEASPINIPDSHSQSQSFEAAKVTNWSECDQSVKEELLRKKIMQDKHNQSFEATHTYQRQQELLQKDKEELLRKKLMQEKLLRDAQQSASISRQQELLRREQQEEYRKKLMQERQDARQRSLAALYQSSRRPRDTEQIEAPFNLPPMPTLTSSRDRPPSLSSSDQRFNQSVQSSLTAYGTSLPSTGNSPRNSWNTEPIASSLTNSGASLRDSWNTEPNALPSMTSQRTGRPRRMKHHLQGIDWSKISNYSMQEEGRTLPGQEMVDQHRPFRPTTQEQGMINQASLMTSPAYGRMTMPIGRNAFGLDTASSRQHHRNVITDALSALEASNDRAYLTMLMRQEHERAQAGEYASQLQGEGQSRIAALQAQMRQLEEHNQVKTANTERHPVDDKQSRVDQLQQEMKSLSSNPNPGMYFQVNPRTAENPPQMGNYVRRASAA